jgi:hypothetical protein
MGEKERGYRGERNLKHYRYVKVQKGAYWITHFVVTHTVTNKENNKYICFTFLPSVTIISVMEAYLFALPFNCSIS